MLQSVIQLLLISSAYASFESDLNSILSVPNRCETDAKDTITQCLDELVIDNAQIGVPERVSISESPMFLLHADTFTQQYARSLLGAKFIASHSVEFEESCITDYSCNVKELAIQSHGLVARSDWIETSLYLLVVPLSVYAVAASLVYLVGATATILIGVSAISLGFEGMREHRQRMYAISNV